MKNKVRTLLVEGVRSRDFNSLIYCIWMPKFKVHNFNMYVCLGITPLSVIKAVIFSNHHILNCAR